MTFRPEPRRAPELSRRRLLELALAAATAGFVAAGCSSESGTSSPEPTESPRTTNTTTTGPVTPETVGSEAGRLELPVPTGRHAVGVRTAELMDTSRRDTVEAGADRRIVVSIWYPTVEPGPAPAPWLPPALEASYLEHLATEVLAPAPSGPPSGSGQPVGTPPGGSVPPGGGPVLMTAPPTEPATPIDLAGTALPIGPATISATPTRAVTGGLVVYSPGFRGVRAHGTTIGSELASQGHVVVAIDHPGDAIAVQLTDGTIRAADESLPDIAQNVAVRTADVRFLLDVIDRTVSTSTATAPAGWPAEIFDGLDTERVIALGHSLGGATALNALAADPRIIAAVDLDGSLVSAPEFRDLADVATAIGDHPFMILVGDGHGPDGNDPTLSEFWDAGRGWARWIEIIGAGHLSFSDQGILLEQMMSAGTIPSDRAAGVETAIGTAPTADVVEAVRTMVSAFIAEHHGGASGSLVEAVGAVAGVRVHRSRDE